LPPQVENHERAANANLKTNEKTAQKLILSGPFVIAGDFGNPPLFSLSATSLRREDWARGYRATGTGSPITTRMTFNSTSRLFLVPELVSQLRLADTTRAGARIMKEAASGAHHGSRGPDPRVTKFRYRRRGKVIEAMDYA
jgi:hypothetical protein